MQRLIAARSEEAQAATEELQQLLDSHSNGTSAAFNGLAEQIGHDISDEAQSLWHSCSARINTSMLILQAHVASTIMFCVPTLSEQQQAHRGAWIPKLLLRNS
eukprot:scaffold78919_cov24-Tisochrysis_lutea.AAC.2